MNISNRKALLVMLCVCCFASHSQSAEYSSLSAAIQSTVSPRTYTLEANEVSSGVLGNIGGSSSIFTIDGGEGHYGINNTSTAANTRLFVNTNQTLYLQNLGTYTTTTSSAIIDGIDVITSVEVGNSVNNFGVSGDYVGFLRSAGTSYVSNSVFANNFGRYGSALQNRQTGTMTITGSVFVGNTSEQGTVHNDSTNKITEISDSIFYNNTATEGSAIYNKATATIDLISGTTFVSNTTSDSANTKNTGVIYNLGTIGTIADSIFYNNSSVNGGVINNLSGSSITTISGSKFANNVSTTTGSTVYIASDSTIGTITDSLFTNNTGVGGILNIQGALTNLTNTDFTNNTVSAGNAIVNILSGVANGTVSIADISNSNIIGNTGSGVMIKSAVDSSTVNITQISNLKSNENSGYGFIVSENSGNINIDEISQSEFSGNGNVGFYIKNSTSSGKDSGDILIDTIDDIKVYDNTSGGIVLWKGSRNATLQINEMNNIEVVNNTKTEGYGAGLYNNGAYIGKISGTTFDNDGMYYATSGTQGGAIFNSGTINEMENITITDCSAYVGAAIFNTGTIGSITNMTISGCKSSDNVVGNESGGTIGVIDNLTIENCSGSGLSFYGASATTIKNSSFLNMYGHLVKMGYGIQVSASPNAADASVDLIDNVLVSGNQTGGLRIDDNKSANYNAHVGLVKNS